MTARSRPLSHCAFQTGERGKVKLTGQSKCVCMRACVCCALHNVHIPPDTGGGGGQSNHLDRKHMDTLLLDYSTKHTHTCMDDIILVQ